MAWAVTFSAMLVTAWITLLTMGDTRLTGRARATNEPETSEAETPGVARPFTFCSHSLGILQRELH